MAGPAEQVRHVDAADAGLGRGTLVDRHRGPGEAVVAFQDLDPFEIGPRFAPSSGARAALAEVSVAEAVPDARAKIRGGGWGGGGRSAVFIAVDRMSVRV